MVPSYPVSLGRGLAPASRLPPVPTATLVSLPSTSFHYLSLASSFFIFHAKHQTLSLHSYSSKMSATAQRRLLQEYRALTNNPPDGITAGPVSEDDLLHWEALIQGPEGTPFEGGIFPAELKFPKDYPLAPPSMRFLGEVWHPNGIWPFLQYCKLPYAVLPHGSVCTYINSMHYDLSGSGES